MATDSGLSVLAWAQERHDNSVQIASTKTGGDRVGWLEDVTYWTAIIDALSENERLRIACASGWGEPVLVNTLRAERDAARAEARNALHLMAAWGCRDVLAHEEETCALCRAEHALEEARAERDALRDAICPEWREKGLRDVLVNLAAAHRSDSDTMDDIGDGFDVSYRSAIFERDAARAEVAQARAELQAALLNEAEATIATLRAALQAAHAVLADVRPMLCDILKLCSDISAGDDYEAVARVIDRIDALQANRSTAREIDLGDADAPQSRADGPREPSTTPSSVEGPAGPRPLAFSEDGR